MEQAAKLFKTVVAFSLALTIGNTFAQEACKLRSVCNLLQPTGSPKTPT
jgi:hypothetical protein